VNPITMNNQVTGKSFIFNEEIAAQCITDLYADDYAYVEEVFGTVLNEYDTLVANLLSSYSSSDLASLRSAVHKIKPVFGFVGMLALQRQCQEFEQNCQTAPSFDHIAANFALLKDRIFNAKSLIEEEKRKLELFNGRQL
jgi:HPt (histidine-containing phosphotransfer) domain-containing protein